MWRILRSLSDTLGVGFLIMQLVKLIGTFFTIVGPLKFLSSMFAGIFPVIANFLKDYLGLTVNGMDVMSVSIAVSGTLIVASSVATKTAMTTQYFWRFLLIPYALIVIVFAILVQIATPMVEVSTFGEACRARSDDPGTFYGSSCGEMVAQLNFLLGPDPNTAPGELPVPAANGIGFGLSVLYLIVLLPLIAVVIFFFKRLSVNKLLARVLVAAGSAIGLTMASYAYASAYGA
ncbi:MAG: hypothetical protein AAGL90_01420 [Pseudomonadota bacterium]